MGFGWGDDIDLLREHRNEKRRIKDRKRRAKDARRRRRREWMEHPVRTGWRTWGPF